VNGRVNGPAAGNPARCRIAVDMPALLVLPPARPSRAATALGDAHARTAPACHRHGRLCGGARPELRDSWRQDLSSRGASQTSPCRRSAAWQRPLQWNDSAEDRAQAQTGSGRRASEVPQRDTREPIEGVRDRRARSARLQAASGRRTVTRRDLRPWLHRAFTGKRSGFGRKIGDSRHG